jgi:hypothetical protein
MSPVSRYERKTPFRRWMFRRMEKNYFAGF